MNNKSVLYMSNIEVPYRVEFFNQLSEYCDLTVLYTRKKSSNRDSKWSESVKKNYRTEYLGGINITREDSFSLKIIKYIFTKKYDSVIVGCYNSLVYMLAILLMKIFGKKYIINVDGEVFLNGNGTKTKLKRFFLNGAEKYLAAGENAAKSLYEVAPENKVYTYFFSSLTNNELQAHAKVNRSRNDTVLVVGQYFDYKGMDVALEAARQDSSIHYKFVGMGGRTDNFISDTNADKLSNVEIVPFLQKKELEHEYQSCAALLLPSRQECWGLVINEAASFGTPIVSTLGSGAAVEFIGDTYPMYLAKPDNPDSLLQALRLLLSASGDKTDEYSQYLIQKSKNYSIEKNVQVHLIACNIITEDDGIE